MRHYISKYCTANDMKFFKVKPAYDIKLLNIKTVYDIKFLYVKTASNVKFLHVKATNDIKFHVKTNCHIKCFDVESASDIAVPLCVTVFSARTFMEHLSGTKDTKYWLGYFRVMITLQERMNEVSRIVRSFKGKIVSKCMNVFF